MMRTALALLALAASAHAQTPVSGVVFMDANGNGVRDPGERGVPNVVVSNQDAVEKTDASGHFSIARGPTGIVYVSVPPTGTAPSASSGTPSTTAPPTSPSSRNEPRRASPSSTPPTPISRRRPSTAPGASAPSPIR